MSDANFLTALPTEGTKAWAFLVDERRVDRRTRGKERLGAFQDFVAAQARREFLNGSCLCGPCILKGRSRRNIEPTPGSDSSEISPCTRRASRRAGDKTSPKPPTWRR